MLILVSKAVLTSVIFAFNANAAFTSVVLILVAKAVLTSERFAFVSNAAWVAVETGFLISDVLFTSPKPKSVFVKLTLPVYPFTA